MLTLGEILIKNCGHMKHMCLYCKCKIWNGTRHMICKHVRESLVKEAIQLLLKSLERGNYWKQITWLSDFDENIKLMRNLEPPIFVVRKHGEEKRNSIVLPMRFLERWCEVTIIIHASEMTCCRYCLALSKCKWRKLVDTKILVIPLDAQRNWLSSLKRIAKQEDVIAINVILPRNFEKIVMSWKAFLVWSTMQN